LGAVKVSRLLNSGRRPQAGRNSPRLDSEIPSLTERRGRARFASTGWKSSQSRFGSTADAFDMG